MTRGIFVTGTDTGVGKTLVAAALIRRFRAQGLRVAGMKPVASGAEVTAAGLRNEDALLLQQEANVALTYAQVNPYVFEPAIAPHLAAAAAGITIDLSLLTAAYRTVGQAADVVIVEGAGGWRVPLGPDAYLSAFPEMLGLEVVLVVGLRLGCLNHALLTAEAIGRAEQARLVGWIGNCIEPGLPCLEGNIASLKARLPAPCLGIVPPLGRATVTAAAAVLADPG